METMLDRVQADALRPSVNERARLAQRLLASLDEDATVEHAWDVEVERRIGEIENGTVRMIPIAEALAQLRASNK